jgi:aldehyde dehydrogenase (NAD+)
MTSTDIENMLAKHRAYYASRKTLAYEFRKDMLGRLKEAVARAERQVLEALEADLGKSEFEAYASEIGFLYEEIDFARKRLRRWMRPRRVPTPVASFPARSYVQPSPLGICLIVAPWNYPLQLLLSPLVGAIAAGNVAVLKPSEIAPATASIIGRIIADAFPPDYISVVQGDGRQTVPPIIETGELDHVFFTGGVEVGREVARLAAEHHTPVTLELGGKSPAIVHEDADLEAASRRLMYGKVLNAGQTCIAPDYLLVHKSVKEAFLTECARRLDEFFPSGALASADYGKMVSDRHYRTVKAYLGEGDIVHGGRTVDEDRKIEPTIIDNPPEGSPLLSKEIFGPVLPVLSYGSIDEAELEVRRRPYPLSLYLFTKSRDVERRIVEGLSFGGGCVNETIMHIANPRLPFGGVRSSGNGSYHGKAGFDQFTHRKAILKAPNWFSLPMKYPPYSEKALRLVRRIFG